MTTMDRTIAGHTLNGIWSHNATYTQNQNERMNGRLGQDRPTQTGDPDSVKIGPGPRSREASRINNYYH
jgi:hypothetical protein